MTATTIHTENTELQKLININEDACEFYSSAKETAESPEIEATFNKLEWLHKDVVTSLQTKVRQNGETAEADSTITGNVRKIFGEISAKLSSDKDETLVSHLEEAEDRCLHSMQDAMEGEKVSSSTKAFLQTQMSTLKKTHDFMKMLKDQMKSAA